MTDKITTMEQLKAEAKEGLDCFIALNGGCRSSKHIWYDEEANQFEIINEIDGSEQCLTSDDILKGEVTNIGLAMKQGALIKY